MSPNQDTHFSPPKPHDLGGRTGFEAVPVNRDDVFTSEWERRSFGVSQAAQGLSGFNTDAFRHGLEREAADRYLTLGYWHRWILNAERMLVEGGVLAVGAVSARLRAEPVEATPHRTTDCLPHGERGNTRQPSTPALFEVGDDVHARGKSGETHTRLPGYVNGHVGVVTANRGVWVFPDTHAHGNGESPQWVYTVAFHAETLWGPYAGTHEVSVDLFEPYLEAK